MVLRAAKRDRLYKYIVDEIKRGIVTGELHPGDQLPTEQELVERYGVSRTVVREAIKALDLQGLVAVSPGRGMFITQPPIDVVTSSLHLLLKLEDHAFDELLVARRILEVPVAGLAALHASADDLARLSATLAQMRATVLDSETFIEFDTAFHAQMAHATQNTVLVALVQPILGTLAAIRAAAIRVPDMAARALAFHERIFAAVAAHDQPAAEESMRAHLAQVAQDIARARDSEH